MQQICYGVPNSSDLSSMLQIPEDFEEIYNSTLYQIITFFTGLLNRRIRKQKSGRIPTAILKVFSVFSLPFLCLSLFNVGRSV